LEVVVNGGKNEKFVHSMKDLCDELDKRIAKLEQFRDRLQGKINNNINVAKNSESLARVSNSLHYSKDARRAMEDSCCGYSCQYELEDQ
jgi:hypothetical protein